MQTQSPHFFDKQMIAQPKSIAEVQSIVKQASRVAALCGGTKPGLVRTGDDLELINMSTLSGILEYQPEEYTFTALAGTPLKEISQALDEYGQYLAFDAPLARRGATLGGTVASGLSGPGRYHYGGVRDFLLEVRFVDGLGQLVHGGAKVVKNVAGFDLPKLMVGSLGDLGIMVELSFKIFPKPAASVTKRFAYPHFEQAFKMMKEASNSRLDLEALDLQPLREGCILWVRFSGPSSTLPARTARLEKLLGEGETLEGEQDQAVWEEAREFDWVPDGWSLVKLPLTPGKIPDLHVELTQSRCIHRFSVGGQVAWIALEGPLDRLEEIIKRRSLNALVILGQPGIRRLGEFKGRVFYSRIQSALDPEHRFAEA